MKKSAGILAYRMKKEMEVFLVHPGGPFWAKKDAGSWSIPKGEYDETEDALPAAKREFSEETGITISGKCILLGEVKLKSGKLITAFAVEKDFDADNIKSNLFEMEWPPKSGKKQKFPEVDKGEWFTVTGAREKMNPAQIAFLAALAQVIDE